MAVNHRDAIERSGLSIYDEIETDHQDLRVPTQTLERILDEWLRGMSLAGYAVRTRSKIVKTQICRALGYTVPPKFRNTRPKFPGQDLDAYVQKGNNLQIWNEDVSLDRRYALVRVNDKGEVVRVKVVHGYELASLDTTGALTQKHQARLILGKTTSELIAPKDTSVLAPLVSNSAVSLTGISPLDDPAPGKLLSIENIFHILEAIVGRSFPDPGSDQNRKRGAMLHSIVCLLLGYADFRDDGRHPDVRNQLLEIKLQTSPTIDLGLIRPDCNSLIGLPEAAVPEARYCDVRYAIFNAVTDGTEITVTHFLLTTGNRFFHRFPQYEGKKINRKLQITLPSDFFLT